MESENKEKENSDHHFHSNRLKEFTIASILIALGYQGYEYSDEISPEILREILQNISLIIGTFGGGILVANVLSRMDDKQY